MPSDGSLLALDGQGPKLCVVKQIETYTVNVKVMYVSVQ